MKNRSKTESGDTPNPSWRREVAASRRINTKEKLISAAARVVAQMGARKARIEDVISEARVARGTFYNYYSTLEELFSDLWSRVGQRPFEDIQLATQSLKDPAERLACGAQQILSRAATDHTWGWLLYALSAASHMPEDLLSYPKPDLISGRRTGRFRFSNLDSASDMTVGTLRTALHALLTRNQSADYVPEVVRLILRALDISESDADAIVSRTVANPQDSSPLAARHK